jgi:hypothetical protein
MELLRHARVCSANAQLIVVSMDADEQSLGYYRAEHKKALQQVRTIDEDGWRFFGARGSEELREITAEYRALQVRIIELLDQLISSSEQGPSESERGPSDYLAPARDADSDHDVPP